MSTSTTFPIATQLMRRLRTSAPKPSSRSTSPAPVAKPKTASSEGLDLPVLAGMGLALIAAIAINLLILYAVLSLLAPQLPLACATIYGSGYGLMLIIGKLEEKEEKAWGVAMKKKEAEEEELKKRVQAAAVEEDF